MAPKSSQAARRAKVKAKAAPTATAPSGSPFDDLDARQEPDAQAVASAMRIFEGLPEDGATHGKDILREWAAYFHEVGCYTRDKSLVLMVANMDELKMRGPPLNVTPRGEARRTFRMMPDGQCKAFVREYAEQLQREGWRVEDAMQAAQRQSIEDYPETWVIIRGMQHGPWDANDIALALRSAQTAVQLRQSLTDAAHGDEQRPERPDVRAAKGAGKGFVPFQGAGRSLGE